MIPRIKVLEARDNYLLYLEFEDGKKVLYDVGEDIRSMPAFAPLQKEYGLFKQAKIDTSRTVVYWNEEIDLPSDTLYFYGKS